MLFPVIRYHVKHGCESFKNQEDLDWALGHGWVDYIPDNYNRKRLGFEPSRIPASLVMQKLKMEAEKEPTGLEKLRVIESKPSKRYISKMNLTDLLNECSKRGIDLTGLDKRKARNAIGAYDNSHNTNK